jgi:hypothetical protein
MIPLPLVCPNPRPRVIIISWKGKFLSQAFKISAFKGRERSSEILGPKILGQRPLSRRRKGTAVEDVILFA